jgi:Tfp pilus assembly protein PilE
MGQQQLLLIVLGVIIVGIAVVVGINVFTASSTESNRDAVIADLTNLASIAHQYYRKPVETGGGGKTFTGWAVPATVDTTGNGIYTATVTEQSITLVGTGNEKGNNGTSNVQVTMIVNPEKIESTTIDN